MPLSSVLYTANGSTNQFDITFPYIDSTHIKVFVNNVEDTNFTFVNTTRIQTSSTPTNGQVVKIERQTPTSARLVDFQDGSVLTETDLDKSANQNFFIVQENADDIANKLGKDNAGIFDAGSVKIQNVSNPTNQQDAVTINYLEQTFLTPADKTALTNVNSNISNINAVNSNSSNINSAVSNATNINTVAGNNSNINTVAGANSNITTVAGSIANVNTVASDLNEGTSEIDTVATNITNVNNVGNDIANVNSVAGSISNVNSVAGNASNINTVAGINSDVTSVAGISSAVSAVNSNSSNINSVNSNSSNINTVAGAISNVNSVGSNISNVNAVNSNSSNINAVNSNSTNINTVAGISTNVTSVANIAGDVTSLANSLEKTFVVTVANVGGVNVFVLDGSNNPTIEMVRGNEYIFDVSDSSNTGHPLRFKDGSGNSFSTGVTVTGTAGQAGAKVSFEVPSTAPDSMRYYCTSHGNAMGNTITVSDSAINTVASNITNINAVAGNQTNINAVNSNSSNINTVGSSISNINTVATNISGVNSFADRYRVQSGVPSSSNDIGDLVFDTAANTLKVFGSSGFQNAGSSVNGTSARFTYTISGTPTTVSGNDDNGESLSYDAGFVDVYLNGVKQVNGVDVTVTSGNSVVFASALANGDIVDIVGFGTFQVASINANNISSGTVPIARLGSSGTKDNTTFLRGDNTFAVVDTTNASNLSTGTLPNARLNAVPNSALANNSITINGSSVALGGSVTVEQDFSWETKTSDFNVSARRGYFVDTSSGVVTATLPASPSAGDDVRFIDSTGSFDTNNLTIARNGKKIQGDASDLTVATERAGLGLVFSGDTNGWLLIEK